MLSYTQKFLNQFQLCYVLKKHSLTINYSSTIISILRLLYLDGFIKNYKILNNSKVTIFFLYHKSLPFFKIKQILKNDLYLYSKKKVKFLVILFIQLQKV